MSLFRRPEQRGILGVDQFVPSRVYQTYTGKPVSYDTAASIVAASSAVGLIANMGAMLPLNTYLGSGNQQRQVANAPFLDDPGGMGYGLHDWLFEVLWQGAWRSNVVMLKYGLDGWNRPTSLQVQMPEKVTVNDSVNGPTWSISGVRMPRDRVVHWRRWPIPGHIMGQPALERHPNTFGLSSAAEEFAARFFGDGAHPTAILYTDQNVDEPTAATIKQRFIAAIRGAREPAVLGKGLKYQAVQVAQKESQFLETKMASAAEVARIWGPSMPEILGYETGNPLTYNNPEQRMVQLLTMTLDPWLVWIEQNLSRLETQNRYLQFDRDAILRTDTLTRYQSYQYALRDAWLSINEVRDRQSLQPVEWGDKPFAYLGPTPAPGDLVAGTGNPEPTSTPSGFKGN
jgi:HK97 family phage portal protein